MSAVRVDIKLQSIDEYILLKHGALRALTIRESDVLFQFNDLIQQAIRDRWPVDTGTSRDKWGIWCTGTGGDVAIIIENEMYYASEVENELYTRLIPAIWNAVKEECINALKREIDRTESILAEAEESERPKILMKLLGGQ